MLTAGETRILQTPHSTPPLGPSFCLAICQANWLPVKHVLVDVVEIAVVPARWSVPMFVRIFTISYTWLVVGSLLCLGLLVRNDVASADDSSAEPSETLTFEQHIWPILRAHCFDCHGATEEMKGSLDLRQVRRMTEGGNRGPAIEVGDAEASLLVQRIEHGEMPPGEGEVSAEELTTLRRWIASGAETKRTEPESIGPGLGIMPEEREHWAYQPIRRPDVPARESLPPERRARTPIDALLISSGPGEPFAPDADRRTLVMRASLTLTGLPPSYEQVERWRSDPRDDWFDRLLDELLESPHYGERWGRHWLDVAGYADSEGYTVQDAVRPWAWRYRDWVIGALNEDKPLDQFITEQLAGDELAGAKSGDWTSEQIDLLTATGYLRMAADGTASENNAEARNQTIADTLQIVGTSLLGLSVQCAQCHDHRYDPILHTDYFALRAVFEPALDWQAWKPPAARQVSLYTEADRAQAAEVEAEAQAVSKEKAEKQAEYMQQALENELEKYDQPLRDNLQAAYQTSAEERTDEQQAWLDAHPSVNITPGVLYQYLPESAEELKTYDKRIAEIRAKKPPEPFVRALLEPSGHAPETKLFHRGDHQQPKQTVLPAAPTVAVPEGERVEFPINDDDLPTTGRRLAFARWLASSENPLTPRVIVNRVWMHHFGQGLVATPADFGKLGATPTHPELLDWLADEFVRQGWSLKKLHRLIMRSTRWQQRRGGLESATQRVPTDLLRLEAEAIRDRVLAVTGQLDPQLFGPPLGIAEDDTGQVVVDGDQTRRSLYVQTRRSRPVAMLQAFDAPVMETNCVIRPSSTVATQSLMLLNGKFILDQATKLAERATAEAPSLPQRYVGHRSDLPERPASDWQYGYGAFDEQTERTGDFTPLEHWTGSQWQAGPELPDPQRGWVLLNAQGGHPDAAPRAVIRRWTATADGVVSIRGQLSHGSSNGDGVRGRVVSSRSGEAGQWRVHNDASDTIVDALEVVADDTIDLITDCRQNHTSDSFHWPVSVTLSTGDGDSRSMDSVDQFQGPIESYQPLPARIVQAWRLAFSRDPDIEEFELAIRFVARQLETMHADPEAIPSGRTAAQQALTNLCQTLMSSNEFLYVE